MASNQTSSIHVTVVVQNRFMFDTEHVTGERIKETANIPADFNLHRRVTGGNQLIGDDQLVELHEGDHFFAQPRSMAGQH